MCSSPGQGSLGHAPIFLIWFPFKNSGDLDNFGKSV